MPSDSLYCCGGEPPGAASHVHFITLGTTNNPVSMVSGNRGVVERKTSLAMGHAIFVSTIRSIFGATSAATIR